MNFDELKERLQLTGDRALESNWHEHSNGGSWVENCCLVDASAFVGQNALVYGAGTRLGNGVRVEGTGTEVCDGAHASGVGTVIKGGARVVGKGTQISSGVVISGEGTEVSNGVQVYGRGTVVSNGARINQAILVFGETVTDDRYFTAPESETSPRASVPSIAARATVKSSAIVPPTTSKGK